MNETTPTLSPVESWPPVSRLPDAELCKRIAAARSVDELKRIAAALPEVQLAMLGIGLHAVAQGRRIAALVDACTCRLITLAEQEMGPAPAAYAWLACGSQGRGEQTIHTDQDNALIHADGLDADTLDWFRKLAVFVTDGLAGCGIPHCPGGVSPVEADWRRDCRAWRERLLDTVTRPQGRDVMLASHYFDLRVVHGDAALFDPIRNEALAAAAGNSRFLGLLGENVLRGAAGVDGLLKRLRGRLIANSEEYTELKKKLLLPVSQLALHYALRGGLVARNTQDRLEAAEQAGTLGRAEAADLSTAYALATQLRLEHLAYCLRQGEALSNSIALARLGPLQRRYLQQAVSVTRRARRALRLALGG